MEDLWIVYQDPDNTLSRWESFVWPDPDPDPDPNQNFSDPPHWFQLVTTYIESRHQLSTVSHNIRHLLDCVVAHQIQQLLGGSGIRCFVREHRANHESQLIR